MLREKAIVSIGRLNTLMTHVQRNTQRRLANEYKRATWEVSERVPYDTFYHCCTQRTASQWIRLVLHDPTLYKYTGLLPWPYESTGLRRARLKRALPRGTFGVHLYIDFDTFKALPKPDDYRAFFVMRDPRDVVVSWYFSALYSHKLMGVIPEMRIDLRKLNFRQGMFYIIDRIAEFGTFEAQLSWMEKSRRLDNVRIFYYEDLAADSSAFWRELFKFLEIKIIGSEFDELVERVAYEKVTGRKQGDEDVKSHHRKGVAGDWQNYFDDSTLKYFNDKTGDLLHILGYECSNPDDHH